METNKNSHLHINRASPGELFIRNDGKTCVFIRKDVDKYGTRYRFRLLDEHEDRKKEIEHYRSNFAEQTFCPDIEDKLPKGTDYFQDWINNPKRTKDSPCRKREGDWTVNWVGHHSQWKNDPKHVIKQSDNDNTH